MSNVREKIKSIYKKLNLLFVPEKYNSKVFCIGYNKTGTTSLGESLIILGYKHSSYDNKVWFDYYAKNKIVKIMKYTAKFESLDDLPWLKEDMIPILDKVFPGSKFIYLTRDEESWKKSIYHWTYKLTGEYPDLQKCIKEYRLHHDFVFEYFKDRSEKEFLVLDIKEKGGFKRLANFLDKTPINDDFPYYNKTFKT